MNDFIKNRLKNLFNVGLLCSLISIFLGYQKLLSEMNAMFLIVFITILSEFFKERKAQ